MWLVATYWKAQPWKPLIPQFPRRVREAHPVPSPRAAPAGCGRILAAAAKAPRPRGRGFQSAGAPLTVRPAVRCWLDPATSRYSVTCGDVSGSSAGRGTFPREGWGGGARPTSSHLGPSRLRHQGAHGLRAAAPGPWQTGSSALWDREAPGHLAYRRPLAPPEETAEAAQTPTVGSQPLPAGRPPPTASPPQAWTLLDHLSRNQSLPACFLGQAPVLKQAVASGRSRRGPIIMGRLPGLRSTRPEQDHSSRLPRARLESNHPSSLHHVLKKEKPPQEPEPCPTGSQSGKGGKPRHQGPRAYCHCAHHSANPFTPPYLASPTDPLDREDKGLERTTNYKEGGFLEGVGLDPGPARWEGGKGVARGMQGGGNRNEGKMKEVGLRVLAGLEVKVGKEVEWWLGANGQGPEVFSRSKRARLQGQEGQEPWGDGAQGQEKGAGRIREGQGEKSAALWRDPHGWELAPETCGSSRPSQARRTAA
ncbi:hypothetical protein Cadr_000008352 [Camelus dromedarius]|uniref:Uncharacterized protein n=1 Tax=Camelus dromedarius TaxID=9838 RepID=A0A5N4DZ49_CAMDR|nr:hypothetical protein Cadr_000008352 [Camelus dromedarius]